MSMLEIDHLTKVYKGGYKANDDISLAIEAGEVFGLLGPNGAGKTTLVNQIIGLAAPSHGRITLDGVDLVADPGFARLHCSLQPQTHVPIEGVTLRQAINLIGRIRGGRPEIVKQRSQQLIDALDIGEWADRRGEHLSGGVRRLTAFCMAAVSPSRLVILDEPTNDVDPLRRRLLWQEVRRLSEVGAAVLLVTHNVLEAERSVDRLAIVKQGRVAGLGTPADLKEGNGHNLRLELILEPGSGLLQFPPGFLATVRAGRRMMVSVRPEQISQALSWAQALKADKIVEEFAIGPVTLEDVYVRLVDDGDAAPAVTGKEDPHVIATSLA